MTCLDFDDLFKKIKELYGCKNQKEVAGKLGVSPQAITDAKKRNKIPETWIDIVTEKFEMTKEDFCQHEEENNRAIVPLNQNLISSQMKKIKEVNNRYQAELNGFNQTMDEFFKLVKEWQAEQNGRSIRTAIDFIQEFPKRFMEMAAWQKRNGKAKIFRVEFQKSNRQPVMNTHVLLKPDGCTLKKINAE